MDRFENLPHIRLHILEWAGPEPAVILVHGLASNAHVWDAVAPKLSAQHRAVALDQRGHGQSDKPEDGYDFATVVGDLRELIEALHVSRPVLVGHSWGGNVIVQYAATYPEDVAGMVLVDGGFLQLADRPEMTWERVQQEMAPPDLTSLTIDQLIARAHNGFASEYWSPAVEATMRGSFTIGPEGRVRPQLSLANHLKILRALWEQRPTELYSSIRCPVLIVPARRSDPGPRGPEFQAARERQVARAAANLPSSRVLWFEETVHDVPLHRPDELAQAILDASTTFLAPGSES